MRVVFPTYFLNLYDTTFSSCSKALKNIHSSKVQDLRFFSSPNSSDQFRNSQKTHPLLSLSLLLVHQPAIKSKFLNMSRKLLSILSLSPILDLLNGKSPSSIARNTEAPHHMILHGSPIRYFKEEKGGCEALELCGGGGAATTTAS